MTNRLKVEYDLDQVWWKEFKEHRTLRDHFHYSSGETAN